MTNYPWAKDSSTKNLDTDVAIIGAGPGGLALAHALIRLGLRVKVFERARELRPIGAALGLFPNAFKALEAIDPNLCLRVLNIGVEDSKNIIQNPQGDILFQGKPWYCQLKSKYEYPYLSLAWFRLQTTLKEGLPPHTIYLDHYCTGFTQNSDCVNVHFQGRNSVNTALLVGADGINSVVRQQLLNDNPPRYMGAISWRAIVENIDGVITKGEALLISGEGKHFAIVNVGDEFICWTAVALSKSDQSSENPMAAKSRVLEEFCNWTKPVQKIVQATEASSILERGIYDRPSVSHWSKGRVTLLGDAAHPMRPAIGQGTAMAFEDAYELSFYLSQQPNLEAALKKYEIERIARTKVIQERSLTEGENSYKNDWAEQKAESAINWTADEFNDWLYTRNYKSIAQF